MNCTSRVIVLIDMDCFYCQVEENLNPKLKGKPLAVVQYNQWRGGGIIAVNYPARDRGVTRHMRGNNAREKCPEIILAKVPEVRGKADLTKYRDAGKRVADVLQTFTSKLERASVDEAYLDITEVVETRINDKMCNISLENMPNTFVVGNDTAHFIDNVTRNKEYNESDFKLAVGGIIAEEIRAEVFKITGYKCSAGIAHNKILAKLVCGMHKPNKQTILPHGAVPELYRELPIKKIKSLGGKFGNIIAEKLGIEFMGELIKFSQKELVKKFDEKSGCWLYNLARGIDMEPVTTRLISKSIGCCKRFPGKSTLFAQEDIEHWLKELAEEISERLEKDLEENNRRARQMVISFAQKINGEELSSTRTHPLNSYEQRKIFENALKVIEKNCQKSDGSYIVTFLGISVSNFQDVKKVEEITSFFVNMRSNIKRENANIKHSESADLSNQTDRCDEVNVSDRTFEEPRNSLSTVIQTEEIDLASKTTSASPESSSIYSITTEVEHENDNYVYYEQIHPESVSDQSFIDNNFNIKENDNASNTSEDSISEEFNFKTTSFKTDKSPPRNSFFSKYFDANVNRNFNTSRVLENVNGNGLETVEAESSTDDVEAAQSNYDCDEQAKEKAVIVENVTDAFIIENNVCPECGKAISYMDYQSHMDYHFAINLVKEEAHLYKPECNKRVPASPSSSKSTNANAKQKRKACDKVKFRPIAQFFTNNAEQMDEESSRSCSECHKQIRVDDWELHSDFHAAKKLHLEMNVKKTNAAISGANTPKLKGQKNIMGFLKRS